jgi:hypothetical protein
MDKKIEITQDNSFDEVVKYDEEGYLLAFSPDSFLELGSDELRQLKKINRDRYAVYKEIAQDAKKRNPKDEKVLEDFQVASTAGLAARRLEVKGKDENFAYRWERPDMVEDRRDEGWEVVTKGVSTLRNQKSKGIHRIGAQGQEELVLISIPKEKLAAKKERKRLKRQRAIEGIVSESKASIEKLGGIHIDEKQGGDFQPISHEEVSNG